MFQPQSKNYILAVDDDPDISTFIERALSRHGFKVYVFTDPAIALEFLNVNSKDCSLILSDIRMPGMNGYEFVKRTKRINPKVKVTQFSIYSV